MNFVKNIPSKYILLAIVALGFALRINNLTIGFPMLYLSNDEASYHLSALNMIANKTLFGSGNYGPLGAYLQIPFMILAYSVLFITHKIYSLADMEALLITQDGYFMFIPRILSAMFGVLTILSIYKLSIKIFNKKYAALWSGFFVAVSFNLVFISHFARSLSPALFFSTLAAIFAIESNKGKKHEFRNRLLSFVFSAVAFGFHQVMGIIFIFTLVVSLKKPFEKNYSRSLIISLFIWLFLVLLFNYLSLGNKVFQVFRSNNTLGLELVRTPSYWLGKDVYTIFLTLLNSLKLFWYLILADGVILAFALYGFLREYIKKKRSFSANNIRIGFIVFFLISILLSVFIFPPALRYFLPTIVFLPLFAGIAVFHLLTRRHILFSLLIVLLTSFNVIYWNYLIVKEPTFTQMRKWLDTNIPADTPIAVTFYRNVGYVPSQKASEPIRKLRPGYYSRAANLLSNNYYPYNVRNILYVEGFEKDSKIDNLKAGSSVFPFDYIIDAYYKESDRLLNMTGGLRLVAHFSPTEGIIFNNRIPEAFADAANNFPFFVLDRTGPYFDIIKVN